MITQNVVLAGVLGAVLFLAGVRVEQWRHGDEIGKLKVAALTTAEEQSRRALTDLATAAKNISDQAAAARADNTAVASSLDALKKEWKNAKPLPLPAGCRPDPVRVRVLAAGIDTVDKAIAGQRAGGAVPAAGASRNR